MKSSIRKIVTIAVVAALYTLLTYLSALLGLAYGAIQFRLSEALMVLAIFSPEAVCGLALGCVLGNIASPIGIADMFFGTTATLLAAIIIMFVASKIENDFAKCFSVAFFTALINAVVIGAEIVFILIPQEASLTVFAMNATQVAIGEFVVCMALSYPLFRIINSNRYLSEFFINKKESNRK